MAYSPNTTPLAARQERNRNDNRNQSFPPLYASSAHHLYHTHYQNSLTYAPNPIPAPGPLYSMPASGSSRAMPAQPRIPSYPGLGDGYWDRVNQRINPHVYLGFTNPPDVFAENAGTKTTTIKKEDERSPAPVNHVDRPLQKGEIPFNAPAGSTNSQHESRKMKQKKQRAKRAVLRRTGETQTGRNDGRAPSSSESLGDDGSSHPPPRGVPDHGAFEDTDEFLVELDEKPTQLNPAAAPFRPAF